MNIIEIIQVAIIKIMPKIKRKDRKRKAMLINDYIV